MLLNYLKQEIRRGVEHGALDNVGGSAYSETVRLLLDAPEKPFLSFEEKVTEKTEVFIGVVSKLLACKQKLEGTIPQEQCIRRRYALATASSRSYLSIQTSQSTSETTGSQLIDEANALRARRASPSPLQRRNVSPLSPLPMESAA